MFTDAGIQILKNITAMNRSLVLTPIDELKASAKIRARTLGDMENGQPIEMVTSGLNNPNVYTRDDFKREGKQYMRILPVGPLEKSVMFTGSAFHVDQLNPIQLATTRRDPESVSIDFETVSIFFTNKLTNVITDKG